MYEAEIDLFLCYGIYTLVTADADEQIMLVQE